MGELGEVMCMGLGWVPSCWDDWREAVFEVDGSGCERGCVAGMSLLVSGA